MGDHWGQNSRPRWSRVEAGAVHGTRGACTHSRESRLPAPQPPRPPSHPPVQQHLDRARRGAAGAQNGVHDQHVPGGRKETSGAVGRGEGRAGAACCPSAQLRQPGSETRRSSAPQLHTAAAPQALKRQRGAAALAPPTAPRCRWAASRTQSPGPSPGPPCCGGDAAQSIQRASCVLVSYGLECAFRQAAAQAGSTATCGASGPHAACKHSHPPQRLHGCGSIQQAGPLPPAPRTGAPGSCRS